MKSVIIRSVAVSITFAIGVIITLAMQNRPVPATNIPTHLTILVDSKVTPPGFPLDKLVYSVRLPDLAANSKLYDGKLIVVDGIYKPGLDTASLVDPASDAWIRVTCDPEKESCRKNIDRITEAMSSLNGDSLRLQLVGRYTAKAADSKSKQIGEINVQGIVTLKKVHEFRD